MPRRIATTHAYVHCSATKANQHVGVNEIRAWHVAKGYADVGYHFVIPRTGLIEIGRDIRDIGAHVFGHNESSIGICLAGGLDDSDNGIVDDIKHYTARQRSALYTLGLTLRLIYPGIIFLGHRDASPDTNGDGTVTQREWLKTCPGFDVRRELASLNEYTR